MKTYSTEEFINSILRNSFRDRVNLDRSRLNQIAYLTAQEIFNKTGQRIISRYFEVGCQGPILSKVNSYYIQIHDGRTIQEYMKNNTERTQFINEPDIEKIILQIWNKTKYMPISIMISSVPTTQHPKGEPLLLAA